MDLDEFFWTIPLIGGMICITAILAPAATINLKGFFYEIEGFIFLYGYGFIKGSASGFGGFQETFVPEEQDQIIGITVEVTILVIVISLMILSAFLNKMSRLERDKADKICVITGSIVIIMAISWIIGVEQMVAQEISDATEGFISINFWEIADPSWGLIGLFMGGGISLGSGIISIITDQREL